LECINFITYKKGNSKAVTNLQALPLYKLLDLCARDS